MQVVSSTSKTSAEKFARAVHASKRARWDIDTDVIRGRTFDTSKKFLPDGLSLVQNIDFLGADERRFLGQIQGRTYGNIFGLVERFINAKILEIARDYVCGDQTALEGLIRFSDEELKHQELFEHGHSSNRTIEHGSARTPPRSDPGRRRDARVATESDPGRDQHEAEGRDGGHGGEPLSSYGSVRACPTEEKRLGNGGLALEHTTRFGPAAGA